MFGQQCAVWLSGCGQQRTMQRGSPHCAIMEALVIDPANKGNKYFWHKQKLKLAPHTLHYSHIIEVCLRTYADRDLPRLKKIENHNTDPEPGGPYSSFLFSGPSDADTRNNQQSLSTRHNSSPRHRYSPHTLAVDIHRPSRTPFSWTK